MDNRLLDEFLEEPPTEVDKDPLLDDVEKQLYEELEYKTLHDAHTESNAATVRK